MRLLASIPDLAINALGTSAPPEIFPQFYFASVSTQVIAAAIACPGKSAALASVRKLIRMGRADELVTAWLPHILGDFRSNREHNIPHHRSILQCNAIALLPRLLELIVVDRSSTYLEAVEVVSMLIKGYSDDDIDALVSRRILVGRGARKLSPSSVWALLDFLLSRSKATLIRCALYVAGTWSDMAFVKGTDPTFHAHITGILRGIVRRLDADDIEKSALLLYLVQGVQAHLECTVGNSKRLGMVVGEEFSRIVDADHPLNFFSSDCDPSQDASDPYSARSESDQRARKASGSADVEEEATRSAPARQAGEASTAIADSEPGSSPWSAFFGDESDSDDESDFEPDRIHVPCEAGDAVPARDPAAPHFLRPCVQLLISKDFDTFALVLSSLPDLIRQKPVDTEACAAELASRLIHLEDKFSFNDFNVLRMDSLVALVEAAPAQSCPVLTSQVYSRNVTVTVRIDALDALVRGARNLSGASAEDVADAHAVKIARESSKVPKEEAVGTLLRRWGVRRSEPPIAFRNRFVGVASRFFFNPLLPRQKSRGAGGQTSDLSLLKREPILLSRLIMSLGALLECAQHGTGCASMAKASYEVFCWAWDSADAGVRRSCIYCAAVVLLSVPRDILLVELRDCLDDIRVRLARASTDDPDDLCRGHTRAILAEIPILRVAAATGFF